MRDIQARRPRVFLKHRVSFGDIRGGTADEWRRV